MSEIFEPKPFSEIVEGMVERLRSTSDRLTDFNVGSVTRSLLEANAAELDELYEAMYLGLVRAIPEAIYIGFGFGLLPAVAARGVVLVSREDAGDPLVVPAGRAFVSASGQRYTADAELSLGVGAVSGEVVVTAEVAGAAGNAPPGSLRAADAPARWDGTNAGSVLGGVDAETEEQRAERFALFVASLARGTIGSIEYAARLPAVLHPVTGVVSERVQRAAVQESPGHVSLYVHNGSLGASPELLTQVQKMIDGFRGADGYTWEGGYRPAGMRVDVLPMAEQRVDVSLELVRRSGSGAEAVLAAVQEAVERRLLAARPGAPVRPVDLVNAALSVADVDSALVLSPSASIAIEASAILVLGELSVTWSA